MEENQYSPDVNSVSIEKISRCKHYDVVKGFVEETEQTEESYMCTSLNIVENKDGASFEPARFGSWMLFALRLDDV